MGDSDNPEDRMNVFKLNKQLETSNSDAYESNFKDFGCPGGQEDEGSAWTSDNEDLDMESMAHITSPSEVKGKKGIVSSEDDDDTLSSRSSENEDLHLTNRQQIKRQKLKHAQNDELSERIVAENDKARDLVLRNLAGTILKHSVKARTSEQNVLMDCISMAIMSHDAVSQRLGSAIERVTGLSRKQQKRGLELIEMNENKKERRLVVSVGKKTATAPKRT